MGIFQRKINRTSRSRPPGDACAEAEGDYASKHALFFRRVPEASRANRVCDGRRRAPHVRRACFDARRTRARAVWPRRACPGKGRLETAARHKDKHVGTDDRGQ